MASLPFLHKSLPPPAAVQTRFHFGRCVPQVRLNRPLCVRASLSVITDAPQGIKVVEEEKNGGFDLLACPICFKPLQSEDQASSRQFKCESCKKVYPRNTKYLDLTITAGMRNYEELMQPSTEAFRNPIISYVYERGYRQAFQIFGYPGPDEELKLANKYLEPAAGGVLVDVSCATGVSTRRFIKSGLYSTVIGLDFSEDMLEQFQGFVQQDPLLVKLKENFFPICKLKYLVNQSSEPTHDFEGYPEEGQIVIWGGLICKFTNKLLRYFFMLFSSLFLLNLLIQLPSEIF